MNKIGNNVSGVFHWLSNEVSNILEIEPDAKDLKSITPVALSEFESWSDYTLKPQTITHIDINETYNIGKFEINGALNSKFYFADCEIYNLQVDALICLLDDGLHFSTSLRTLIKYGGYNFSDSIKDLTSLRAGQAFTTRCHNVAFQHIILSLCPHYTSKYHRSSCNTLNMSIRECIKLAVNKKLRNIAFELHPVPHDHFPLEHYSQTLLRSLRRWMSIGPINNTLHKVFLVGNKNQLNIYLSTMPLYFPRKASEIQDAEMGNNYGELEVSDRGIKIAPGGNNLILFDDPSFHSTSLNNGSKRRTRAEQVYYAKKSGDWEGDEEAQYAFHSKIAKDLNARGDFKKFKSINFASSDHSDKFGRTLFWFDMRKFPSVCDYNELVHFMLFTFQISSKFTILLANCNMANSTSMGISLFKDLFEIWGAKRLAKLSQLLIHKSSYFIKAVLFALSPFIPPKVLDTTVHIQEHQELLEYIDSKVLDNLLYQNVNDQVM